MNDCNVSKSPRDRAVDSIFNARWHLRGIIVGEDISTMDVLTFAVVNPDEYRNAFMEMRGKIAETIERVRRNLARSNPAPELMQHVDYLDGVYRLVVAHYKPK